MRSLILPMALAAMVLGGAGSVARADDKAPQSTAGAYINSMANTMKGWTDKVGNWTARQVDAAGTATAKATDKTGDALEDAWVAVRRDWQKLQEASADGYDAAEQKFQESLDALDRAWENREEPTTTEPGKS
ncbi:MAG: hypothetical protein P1U88_08970 [Thalassobaculaceae bacterium]|nr:hypothetical protein [Thalassobaculaceae bacterium]